MGPTSLSSSVDFFVSQHFFCLHVVSPARPANHSFSVCLAKSMKHSKGNKRSLGYLVLTFQAASCFIIASRIQAAGFIWIKSPVSFTHLHHCLCRCDLVCDLSGPELPPPDGCPPGAGRWVAVPIAWWIPDRQCQGRPTTLFPDWAAHLRGTAADFWEELSLQNLMLLRLKEKLEPWAVWTVRSQRLSVVQPPRVYQGTKAQRWIETNREWWGWMAGGQELEPRPPELWALSYCSGLSQTPFVKEQSFAYCHVIHMLPWTNLTFLLVLKDHSWIIL